jgi:hypothetical protein
VHSITGNSTCHVDDLFSTSVFSFFGKFLQLAVNKKRCKRYKTGFILFKRKVQNVKGFSFWKKWVQVVTLFARYIPRPRLYCGKDLHEVELSVAQIR